MDGIVVLYRLVTHLAYSRHHATHSSRTYNGV
jgi:hypothetical protein